MTLTKTQIKALIKSENLSISPLLEEDQIGDLTIDFRIGTDFLVTINGSNPFIDASLNNNDKFPIKNSFQETRRKLGETFLLHPNQTVLVSSLEYIKLPSNTYAELTLRSSYLRLGLTISAIVQPGYCGCISMELTNINKVPINLTVGAAIIQARLFEISESINYFEKKRKYMCQVRPVMSAVAADSDLKRLQSIWKQNNYVT
ncbi:dCTP deaminase [Niabella drilacis]|nr:dCTP deaminase [Niabella drilacis]